MLRAVDRRRIQGALRRRATADRDLLESVRIAHEQKASLREIAALLDVTHAAVAKMIRRAGPQLRDEYEPADLPRIHDPRRVLPAHPGDGEGHERPDPGPGAGVELPDRDVGPLPQRRPDAQASEVECGGAQVLSVPRHPQRRQRDVQHAVRRQRDRDLVGAVEPARGSGEHSDQRRVVHGFVRQQGRGPRLPDRWRISVRTLVAFLAAFFALSASASAGTVWVTPAELASKPTSGTAWTNVLKYANQSTSGMLMLNDNQSDHDALTYARALVWARTGNTTYRTAARNEISRAIGSECFSPLSAGNRHIGSARHGHNYANAAQLIDLAQFDPALDARVRDWFRALVHTGPGSSSTDGVATCSGSSDSLKSIHNGRTNNHGTMAGASRMAFDAYLGDTTDFADAVRTLRGWMGDRAQKAWPINNYHGGLSGSGSWMSDPSQPRPVNPAGAVKNGRNVDGAQPQEQARCGAFSWPPCYTGYVWGGLAGGLTQMRIAHLNGYPGIHLEQNSAVRRAMAYIDFLARNASSQWWSRGRGDESAQPHLVNFVYGTSFPETTPVKLGLGPSFTDWTHP